MPVSLQRLKDRIRQAANIIAGEMTYRELIVFYVLCPSILGLLLGLTRAEYGASFNLGVSVVIWPFGLLLNWVAFEFGMLALLTAYPAAKKMPLFLLLVLGGSFGKLVSASTRGILLTSVVGLFGGIRPDIDYLAMDILDIRSVILFMDIFILPIILWAGINCFFIYVLGVPRYGRAGDFWFRRSDNSKETDRGPDTVTATHFSGNSIPPILKGIPDYNYEDIVCLFSEGNYVRIYTASKNWLVRYTFGQALEEFRDINGMQVHRSYWIYSPAVVAVKRRGRSYEVHLNGDLVVPVSRSNINLARRLQKNLG